MAETRRYTIDCRQHPSASKGCTVSISGNEDEVIELAAHHAVRKHGMNDTPEFRRQLKSMLKEEALVG